MRRAAEFWKLAAVQLDRSNGASCDDEELIRLLPWSKAPFGLSWCARAAASVPEHIRHEFVVAHHWLGDDERTGALILPLFMRGDDSRHQQLEDRASLAMLGAVTLQPGPWKARTWVKTRDMLPSPLSRAPVYHGRLSSVLVSEVSAAKVMRDRRQSHWQNWVWLSPKAIAGLGWVLHDGTEKRTSEEQARAVLNSLIETVPAGQEWTPDDIVAWAEFCSDYVDAYRRKW